MVRWRKSHLKLKTENMEDQQIGSDKWLMENRTALYKRVSSVVQAVHGKSLADQDERLTAFCQYMNLDVVMKLSDEGVSGSGNKRRNDWERLMEAIENKEIDVVVVPSISRFARNQVMTIQAIELCDKKGVRFISLSENIDTSTPIGRFFISIIAGFAQLQREYISEDTKRLLQRNKRNGLRAGTIPYGKRLKNNEQRWDELKQRVIRCKELIDDEEEQQNIMMVSNMRQYEELGWSQIAMKLNAMRRFNRNGNAWTANAVLKTFSEKIREILPMSQITD